jgi:hypothetical protein
MKAFKQAKAKSSGRPPKAGVDRYQDGSIVRSQRSPEETEDQIQATVIAYRRKLGVPEKAIRDQRAECNFGRLCLTGVITTAQYEAGRRYAEVMDRRSRLDGGKSPWPAPASLEGGAKGMEVDRLDPDMARDADERKAIEDRIASIRRAYADMYSVLADLEQSVTYRGVINQMKSAIMFDHDIRFDIQKIGNVRSGLNVLMRLWQMRG